MGPVIYGYVLGGGGIFRGRVKKKYCCVMGGGSLHEK